MTETAEKIRELVAKFTKKIYDKYNNPQHICRYLEDAFAVKGIMCGFTWVPKKDQYYGLLQICFIMVKTDHPKFVTEAKLKSPPVDIMPLEDFIINYFNPEGIYLLEKVDFQLEG